MINECGPHFSDAECPRTLDNQVIRFREANMGRTDDDAALNTLFREARTHYKWQDKPVTDETLHTLYDLMKWGPTSANAEPARFAFLRTKEAKERLRPALAPMNVEKVMTAPV